MFGAGRGTVEKVENTIKPTANTTHSAGPLRLESQSYAGYVHYEQRFSNHPLSEHGSFVNDRSINIGDFHGSISNAKLGAVKAKITGREWHPVDAYDAADGGDHPYDSYYYYVYGTTNSLSVQPVELPNLPSFSNPFAKNNQSNQNNNTLPEKGSADADNRTRELTGSDNLPNNPNRQPESIANNGEVPQPQALPQPQSSFWDALASGFWGGLKELAAGARDYQADGAQYSVPVGAWDNGQNQYAQPDPYAPSNYAEGVGANIAAISSIVGTKSPASLGRNVAKHADDVAKAATNVAKKVEKTTDIAKATPPANTQLPATSNGAADKVAKNLTQPKATGSVATRINPRKGDGSRGTGLNYAWKKHGPNGYSNKSRFNEGMTKDDVISILQEKNTVTTPAYKSASGNYVRTVDTGRNIGIDKYTKQPTQMMTVITDNQGNLVNVFPGELK